MPNLQAWSLKALGIDPETTKPPPNPPHPDVLHANNIPAYYEHEPTVQQWLRSSLPSKQFLKNYPRSLFPFLTWIGNYNLQWLSGDLVAGITVGAVVVPQSMAYAQLAELPVQFGLYSSFMGVLIYFFFATSKDITIGPVAVMSLIMGSIVLNARETAPDLPGHVIASATSVVAGCIISFLGLFRLGWIVELISLSSVCAFVTGAAFTIACGQVSTLMGISGFSTRDGAYLTVIRTLARLDQTSLDAALGLTALLMLYLIRSGFNFLARKQPHRRKLWFFCNTLRTAFVILLYTLISWLMNLNLQDNDADNSPIRILGSVPRGFQVAEIPQVNSRTMGLFLEQLPAVVIVLLIEHISIAKSFGRINGYAINPSQELVAIGVTNVLGPFLGGYPATGSFSRTAIKSKAGVRTPLAGVISALVVLLAIYALPAMFFYIPNAALSAVIIHAVLDLLTPPATVYQFWRSSPLDAIIFFVGVLVVVFTSVETGIYATVALSAAVLLFRLFKAKGHLVGPVDTQSLPQDGESGRQTSNKTLFLPLNHSDGTNPNLRVQHPEPGVFIYRFSAELCYLNASRYLDSLADVVIRETRPTSPATNVKKGDRQWNDTTVRPRNPEDDHRPILKAVVFDFSSVNDLDLTTVQAFVDLYEQLGRHTAPQRARWYFANVRSPWAKRALLSVDLGILGRGAVEIADGEGIEPAGQRLYDVATSAEDSDPLTRGFKRKAGREDGAAQSGDEADLEEKGLSGSSSPGSEDAKDSVTRSSEGSPQRLIGGLNRPAFYPDLASAVVDAVGRPF